MSANPARLRRSRLSIDVEPELRRKIKVVAAQKDLTVREYLEAILRRAVEAEEQATTEGERVVWSSLSARSFARDWDSEDDRVYDRPA